MEYLVFKYLWLIALSPKVVQLAVLGVVLFLLYCAKPKRFVVRRDAYYFIVLFCVFLHGLSIVLNVITGTHPLSRIAAAANTFLINLIGLEYYHYYKTARLDYTKLARLMYNNVLILFGVFILFLCVGMDGNVPFMPYELCGYDYVGGNVGVRFRGYLEYTNLVVFMLFYCYILSLQYIAEHKSKLIAVVFALFSLYLVVRTNSRTGILCTLALVALSVILINLKRIGLFYQSNKLLCWIAMGLAGLVGAAVLHEQIASVVSKILNARSGSTSTRFGLYTKSISIMLKESPIWGCGIKNMMGGIPYGSHSTYIGMFYKTGLLGGTVYLLGTAVAVWNVIKAKRNGVYGVIATVAYLELFLMYIFEDMDGSNWNIVVFLALYAILFRNPNIDYSGMYPRAAAQQGAPAGREIHDGCPAERK